MDKQDAIERLLAVVARLQEANAAELEARKDIGLILDAYTKERPRQLQSQAWTEQSAGDLIRQALQPGRRELQSPELQG